MEFFSKCQAAIIFLSCASNQDDATAINGFDQGFY
jgi:hypothetical protein